MTDRELLELAAKAACIELEYDEDDYGCIVVLRKNPSDLWNPLTNDGDALRLAVRLNLNIEYGTDGDSGELYVCTYGEYDEYTGAPCRETFETIASIATRRAIVRAAAEIGRTK